MFNHHRVKCIICMCFGTRPDLLSVFCAQPLPHTLKYARAEREREGRDSDIAFQATPQRTDTYIHKVMLKYPFWQVFW